MPFDRGQRFTQLRPDRAGHPRQGAEHVLFPCSLHLVGRKDVSGAAGLGAQPEHVLRSECGDGAFHDRRAFRAHADLFGYRRSERHRARTIHEAQDPLDTLIGYRAQERRLRQLDRQSQAKSLVEDRIARGVDEIRDDHRVVIGELRGPVQIEVGGC